jgi:hypothetical protein
VVAIVLALSIGIGIYYLQPQLGGTRTSTSNTTTSNPNYPTTAQTANSTLGLELNLSLNSTVIDTSSSSHAISVIISVYNTLPHVNNLSASHEWPIENLSAGSCNYELPLGIAVFNGYYTTANISSQSASSLFLFPALPCPFEPSPASYAFQPNSYYATIVGKPMVTSTSPYTNTTTTRETLVQQLMSDNIPLSGYCCTQIPMNGGFTSGSVPFAAGNYTLVAGDEWGQIVLLHFVVANSITTTSSTNSVSPYSTYTNTMYTASVNINLSDYCPPVSAGSFEFRLVSDPSGAPVNPASISAVDMLTCNGENQVATINEFSYTGGGWIVPVFPSQAMYGGGLNITVTYQGETYNFAGGIPPIGTECVTLHVPSGNVSSSTVMNGSGSYCSQSSTSFSSSNSSYSTLGASSCSKTFSNGTGTGEDLYLAQLSGSTAKLCVRYFYYNTTAPITLNSLSQLTIYAPVQSSGTLRNADSSFLLSANASQVLIGGPQQENEGVLVSYTIKSIGSAPSGTYEIALSSILYPQDIACGDGKYMTLQVGNVTNPVVGTSCHYDPAPQSNPGVVYSEIVGITNSTH